MVIKIDRKAIAFNINKAEKIAGGIPVSIMLKKFYEYIADIECVKVIAVPIMRLRLFFERKIL